MVQFGYEGNSPFKDMRMRQAASMLIDREGYIDVIDNRDGFDKDGLDWKSPTTQSSAQAGRLLPGPQGQKTFGHNPKYLKHNVAEAKKLISAAGTTT